MTPADPAGPQSQVDELAALILRSKALARANEWGAEALDVNSRLVELQPTADGAIMRLARCRMEAGQWDAASESYTSVLELTRSTGRRAIAETRLAECEEARQAAICTSYGEALSRGLSLRDRGKHERAKHWLRRAYALARLPEEKTVVLASWASALRSDRRLNEALRLLKLSIKVDPSRRTNKPSYTVLVATLVDLGHLEQALTQAEQLLRLHPKDAHVLNACGRLFLELSRKSGNPAFARRSQACFAAAGSTTSTR